MLAARVHGWGHDPVVEDAADPLPGAGETLVRVTAAAVGHLDLSVASGTFPVRPELPYVPGTDGAGEVVTSAAFARGAAVRIRGSGVGMRRDGTWAQLAAVPDAALATVPDGVDAAVAASFFSSATTADVAVSDVGRLVPGERVAVTGGAGAVGSLAVQLALIGGAAEVLAVVSSEDRAAGVPAGARVVVGREDPLLDGVDLLVDTVGGPGLPALVGRVRPGGRAVLIGYTAGTEAAFVLPDLLHADVELRPVNLLRRASGMGERGERLLARIAAGELTLRVERYPLGDLAAAIDALRSGRSAGRVVLIP